jgi:peptide-methionine (S)-S-oxide reductase
MYTKDIQKMFHQFILSPLAAALLLLSCNTFSGKTVERKPLESPEVVFGKLDTATFAAGCFWCEEAIFEGLKGVKDAVSGYSGGHTQNPTYEEVCSHTTGHAETVQLYYDPSLISYQTLLEVYFVGQDPTQVNGQGPDHGDSYRSVIFYRNDTERSLAETYIKQLNDSGKYDQPIAVRLEPLTIFYPAEDYHQDYERNHPENAYVQRVSIPRINKVKTAFPQLLK